MSVTNKILIGFRTRPLPTEKLKELMPSFRAKGTLKDKLKIEADILEKTEKFLANAKDMPYTGTFDAVAISDPANEGSRAWTFNPEAKVPICVSVAKHILKAYPNAWSMDTHDMRAPKVVFIGFNPRLFLKMLGAECSLPENNFPLPPKMWYSNSDHRDIETAVLPDEFAKAGLTLETVLKRRRPTAKDDQAAWDKILNGWTGPHNDPVKDVLIATELAVQLGFLND